MKPNDANGQLPLRLRPFRVLILAGSNRRQYNCPGIDSKARTLMLRMAECLPEEWEVDYEDLGNVYEREHIQSCNACVSTSMALCVWPCNCYQKNSGGQPDLMWNLDLYARLDLADAWAIIGPINWYGPSSNLKLMFDRLVCMSGGNPDESLIDHKNPEMAIKLEKTAKWKTLSRNHLEGRTAGFFSYGDGGSDEVGDDGRPKILRHKEYLDPEEEPFENMRDAYAPLVWQCRYSGIEVPEALWQHIDFGMGKKYGDNQAEDMTAAEVYDEFDDWVRSFTDFVAEKGKVRPGKYRAFGYKPPRHLRADLRTKWRGLKMATGHASPGTSPAEQERLGLNRDATLRYKEGEGKKLRKGMKEKVTSRT